jgi:phosphatidylserine/phosphatidylglycerophosphate/cardiolipin synthase-like enzyme
MGEWLRLRDGCPEWASESMDPDVLVNTPGRALLGEELLGSVASARRSVIAINPLLTDLRMLNTLIGARKRGVRIKIITELRDHGRSGVKYPTRGFEAENPMNLQQHYKSIRALVQEGVLCRGLQHYAHGKALVVDDLQLVLSSVNWTENSLGWGVQPSLEAGIFIREPAVVTAWSGTLGNLWDRCPFRLHSLDGDISLQQLPSMLTSASGLERQCRENVQMSWSYPPNHYGILEQLVYAIRSARKSVVISALSFYRTEEVPVLHDTLEDALTRGITMTVIVRPENFSLDKYPDPSTRRLLARGLRLRGVESLHAKGILVDDSLCGMFSANVNPFSLQSRVESAHVECALFTYGGDSLLSGYGRFLKQLNEQATHEYRG